MKPIVFLGLLLSANVAFSATQVIPKPVIPDDAVCNQQTDESGAVIAISCVSKNPPVEVAPPPTATTPEPIVGGPKGAVKLPAAIPDPKMPIIKRRYEANLKKWLNKKQQNYTFTLQRSCHCLPEYTTPMQITVENGKVVSAFTESLAVELRADGSEADSVMIDVIDRAMTIDQLFKEIQQSIDNNAASINVKYDPLWGYPTSIYIDLDKRMADEELAFTISKFQPTRKKPVKTLGR
jgi:hypothetical protein